MITLAIRAGLILAIFRGRPTKPEQKKQRSDELSPELKKFLRELNWYI